jgi:uncharacterized protein (TIGR00661 family)
MRLLLSCSELGLGHVSRITALGRKLVSREHELHFFAGGTAYQLLKKEFPNVYLCRPVAWYESAHGVITSASVLNILIPLPRYNYADKKMEVKSSSANETIHRYYDLRKHILKIKPDLVIADGDMHALRLAHRWNIKSVYITNIIRPSCHFSPLLTPGERFTERYVKKCEKIIVPDNPEHTICEYNLGNLDAIGIRDKVEFVGSFLDMTKSQGTNREEHVFASISGPLGTRAKLANMIIPTLLQHKDKCVISLGGFRGGVIEKTGNCTIYNWLDKEERNEMMKNAKTIVFSGGHSTCFEVIKHRKPSVCIPTQPEQMGNARKLEELRCSLRAENETQLKLGLSEIDQNIESFKLHVKRISEYSGQFKGLDNAVRVIENIA